MPEELKKDIERLGGTLKTYEDVKNYIYEQVAIRRDVKNITKGPVPMRIGKLVAALYGSEDNEPADDMEQQRRK